MMAMGVIGISRAITPTNINNRTHIQCNATMKMSKSALRALTRLTKYHREDDDNVSVTSILRKSPPLSKDSSLALLHSLILYDDCHLALSGRMYEWIKKAKWYKWDRRVHAHMVALLAKHDRGTESETMFVEGDGRLLNAKEKINYYCDLMECYSKDWLKEHALSMYELLKAIPHNKTHVIGYRSLINALANMDLPLEAEQALRDMQSDGHELIASDYRTVMYSFGRIGLLRDMERMFAFYIDAGHSLDTLTLNMILGCYSYVRDFRNIQAWLGKMQLQEISWTPRTANVVAKACSSLTLFENIDEERHKVPLSVESLVDAMKECVHEDELSLIRQLLSIELISGCAHWSEQSWKLDLHGVNTNATYAMLMVWLDEVKTRSKMTIRLPKEVVIVCGMGKHSTERGKSPVKMMLVELLHKMGSPFKLDRFNKGRFVAHGIIVKDWLKSAETNGAVC